MKITLTVINKTLHDLYKNLGFYLMISIFFATSSVFVVTIIPGIMAIIKLNEEKEQQLMPEPSKYWSLLLSYIPIGIKLSTILLFISLPATVYMYTLNQMNGILPLIMSGLMLYILITAGFILFYTMPLMVIQQIHSPFTGIRRGFKLAIENLRLNINIAIYLAFVALICTILLPLFLIAGPFTALLMHSATKFSLCVHHPELYSVELNTDWKGSLKPWQV